MITMTTLLAIVPLLCLAAVAAYCYRKKLHTWLPGYLGQAVRRSASSGRGTPRGCRDIMFLFVDHFELAGKPDRLNAWMDRYPLLAGAHVDSDGCHPRHSWFYALDLLHEHEIESIGQLVDAGLGEIELHWHHDHDDDQSFRRKLTEGMRIFHRHGHMLPYRSDLPASFGFIHGNWSLDNSRGPAFCGVDNEIEILLSQGCYGDFTFPALFNDGQPAMSNSIHYARDNGQPKSYNRGAHAKVGRRTSPDELMIMQGPLLINWKDWRFRWHPTFEDGDIKSEATHGEPVRVDSWIRRGIHVIGRPEWTFVKVFCHGAQDHAAVLGPATERMFSYLEQNFNDGRRHRLHYVSARESFNIVRAAEDGKAGNPSQYRDYVIPAPAARKRQLAADRRVHTLAGQ
jgi:hypothetical protein